MDKIIEIKNHLRENMSSYDVNASKQDTFMIGNGSVSAVLGWGEQINDLGWVLGPYYENCFNRGAQYQGAYFGRETMEVFSEEKVVEFREVGLQRVSQSAIMISAMENCNGIAWETIDYCVPDKNVIMRHIIFQNNGRDTSKEFTLKFDWTLDKEDHRPCYSKYENIDDIFLGLSKVDSKSKKRTLTMGIDRNTIIENSSVYTKIPPIKCGESYVINQVLVIGIEEFAKQEYISEFLENSNKILDETYTYWKNWSMDGAQIHTSNVKFDDLLDCAKVWCKVQQSCHGVFTPMLFYSDAYVRDCNGPFKLFSSLGKMDEVRGILDFFPKAAIYNMSDIEKSNHFSGVNNVRLDVDDFTGNINVDDMDWSKVEPGKAEIPSFIILWHFWYGLQSLDSSFTQKHWRFLLRCLESQHVNDKNAICFHGDETYGYLGSTLTGFHHPTYSKLFSDKTGKYGSFESTVLYLYALDAMKYMSKELGKQDDLVKFAEKGDRIKSSLESNFYSEIDACYKLACGENIEELENPHTIAVSTVNWLNASAITSENILDDKKVKSSWKMAYDFLNTKGWINASPYLPVNDGHLPGFMLCGAKQIMPESIDEIVENIENIATDAGGFSEVYTTFDKMGARGYHGKSWGRLRPWETGINVQSILFAIMGFSFDVNKNALYVNPYLPKNMDNFSIKGFDVKNTLLDLDIERNGENINFKLINKGKNTINVIIDAKLITLKPSEIYLGM